MVAYSSGIRYTVWGKDVFNLESVKKQIRLISMKRMVNAVIMLVLTSIMFLEIPFYDMMFPTKAGSPTVLNELYQNGVTHVEITADVLYYTGYDYTENGKVVGSYYYNLYDGTCIFYLLSPSVCNGKAEVIKNVQIKARLQNGSKILKELIAKMAEDLSWTAQGLSAVSSHIVVNQVDYLLWKSICFLAVSFLVFFISAFVCLYLLAYMVNPMLYPACFRLRKYGDIRAQIEEIDKEIKDAVILQSKEILFTENYLIFFSKISLAMIPVSKISWIYKYSKMHRFRGRRLTYTLRVVGKKSLCFSNPNQTKEDADAVLDYISENYENIMIGYTKENVALAKKRRLSR